MSDRLEREIGRHSDHFQTTTKLYFLKAYLYEDATPPLFEEGEIKHEDVTTYLEHWDHIKKFASGLTILFSEAPSEGSPIEDGHHAPKTEAKKWPPAMAVTEDDFRKIASAFTIPASFFEMLAGGETLLVREQGSHSNGDTTILVQNTLSTKTKFSMSATYDIRKGLTKVFVHGSDAEEISAMVAEVGRNLRSIALPTLTITLFLNQRVGSAVEKIKDSHTTLSEVQNHIGVKTIWHPGKECCKGRDAPGDIRERLRTIDFNETSNKLTSILSRMAYCEFVGNVHLPMVNELEEINKQIVKSPTGSHETVKVAKRNLRGDNEFLKSSFTGVITRSRYLSKRASALQQTVFSLISQRENILSMDDNAELKKMSKHQATAAITASRAASRDTAAIGAVFLPATFTATFFSTTFFDFRASDNQSVVSGWLWLYFLVTVVLSLLVFLYWYNSLDRRELAIKKLLDDDEYEEESRKWKFSIPTWSSKAKAF